VQKTAKRAAVCVASHPNRQGPYRTAPGKLVRAHYRPVLPAHQFQCSRSGTAGLDHRPNHSQGALAHRRHLGRHCPDCRQDAPAVPLPPSTQTRTGVSAMQRTFSPEV